MIFMLCFFLCCYMDGPMDNLMGLGTNLNPWAT